MILNTKQSQIPIRLIVCCLVIVSGIFDVTKVSGDGINDVQWLLAQQVPNDVVPTPFRGRSGLVISFITDEYPLSERAWIHHNALAVIAWSMAGECRAAKNTLIALDGLIDADGKLGFSYNTNNEWFDATYRTGAIAWVGYSFIFYQTTCGDHQFQKTAQSVANWVMTMQDPAIGSVKGGPHVTWFSTEDNIIAYFFLRYIGILWNDTTYLEAANRVKQSLLINHWNSSYGCFQQGIGDLEKYLNAASWGTLFLLSIGELDKGNSCLSFIESNFSSTASQYYNRISSQNYGFFYRFSCSSVSENVNGYKPYIDNDIVYSEGSFGVAMAYQRLGNQIKHDEIFGEIRKMQGFNGGIKHACPSATDFPILESVAGTAWMVILQSDPRMTFLGSSIAIGSYIEMLPIIESSKAAIEALGGQIDLSYGGELLNCYAYTDHYQAIAVLPAFESHGDALTHYVASRYNQARSNVLETSRDMYLYCREELKGTATSPVVASLSRDLSRWGIAQSAELMTQAIKRVNEELALSAE